MTKNDLFEGINLEGFREITDAMSDEEKAEALRQNTQVFAAMWATLNEEQRNELIEGNEHIKRAMWRREPAKTVEHALYVLGITGCAILDESFGEPMIAEAIAKYADGKIELQKKDEYRFLQRVGG